MTIVPTCISSLGLWPAGVGRRVFVTIRFHRLLCSSSDLRIVSRSLAFSSAYIRPPWMPLPCGSFHVFPSHFFFVFLLGIFIRSTPLLFRSPPFRFPRPPKPAQSLIGDTENIDRRWDGRLRVPAVQKREHVSDVCAPPITIDRTYWTSRSCCTRRSPLCPPVGHCSVASGFCSTRVHVACQSHVSEECRLRL